VFSSSFIYLFYSIVVLLIVSKLPNLAILQQKNAHGIDLQLQATQNLICLHQITKLST
jgi:hypothetical protein